jgi:probable FeS assembly SUF system protein SufT
MSSMKAKRTIVVTQRECPGRLVPVGDPVTIPKDTFVTITQSAGGTYTVVHQGNMVRVDGADADALGYEKLVLDFEDSGDGQIHEDFVWQALNTVFDPEIPVSLPSLGLIYELDINQAKKQVMVTRTLTAPGCGMGPVLVGDVEQRVLQVPNVETVEVELVFDPPWSREMMSEDAQLETGMFF